MSTRMRFIGTDGSMGLRKGAEYDVTLEPAPLLSRSKLVAYINRGDRVIGCPYSSSDTFFKNWITPS